MVYVYPRNIKTAAALLDTIKPGWAEKIDLTKLDQSSGYTCILGQVQKPCNGSGYSEAMKLFGYGDVIPEKVMNDTVFGRRANVQVWVKEIQSRLSSRELTWAQALDLLTQGKKIAVPGGSQRSYIFKQGDYLRYFDGTCDKTYEVFVCTLQELAKSSMLVEYVPQLTLRDIKHKQRFVFKTWPDVEFTLCEKGKGIAGAFYYMSSDFVVHHVNDGDSAVELRS